VDPGAVAVVESQKKHLPSKKTWTLARCLFVMNEKVKISYRRLERLLALLEKSVAPLL